MLIKPPKKFRPQKEEKPFNSHFAPYHARNKILKDLGYKDYPAYLASDFWKDIRAEVLTKYPDCRMCGKPATCVHHTDYSLKVLVGADNEKLYSLCSGCHMRIEFSGKRKNLKGKRGNLSRVNRRLRNHIERKSHGYRRKVFLANHHGRWRLGYVSFPDKKFISIFDGPFLIDCINYGWMLHTTDSPYCLNNRAKDIIMRL